MPDDRSGIYTLVLAKQDFKFSCAHFTLFSAERAELLHGHNYQVKLELRGSELDEEGLLANIEHIKKILRQHCHRLDSRTLVPSLSPHLEISSKGGNTTVRYRERTYSMPDQDVILLPLVNTSIELLACWLWETLAPVIDARRISWLLVEISETAGQSCSYGAGLPIP